jgi:tRNA-specific 2-thiouridylase
VDDKASFPEVLKDALGDGAGAGERPGKIVDTSGRALGTHRGVYRYTIGQRKGLGVASTERLYVVELRPSSAEVVLGPQEELYGDTMEVGAVRWAPGFPPDGPLEGEVQIRYRHRAAPATITARRDGRGAEVVFRDPQKSITPGQAAVFYRDDLVIGGGRIDGQ